VKKAYLSLTAVALCAGAHDHVHAEGMTPKVSLFGTVNAQLENVQTSGSATSAQDKPSRLRVSNVSSDLGVKASIELNDKMTGLFQYVTGVSVDNANANTNSGMWANAKDVFVGVRFTDVATIKLGRLTGAARWNSGTPDFSPSGAGPQDNQAALSGISGQSAAAPLFNVRMDNAVGIETASFKGLSARLYYGANEGKSNAEVSSGTKLDDASYSAGLQYVWGPVDTRVSYEVRTDKGTLNNTTGNHTRDTDMRLGVRYTLPTGTTLALGYDRMTLSDFSATGAAKSELHKTGWAMGAKQAFGPHVMYGGLGKAGDLSCKLANAANCDGKDTGMRQWVVAYNYNFNADMLFEAYFSQLANQARAKYDYDSGGLSPGTGATLRAIGVGLRYAF